MEGSIGLSHGKYVYGFGDTMYILTLMTMHEIGGQKWVKVNSEGAKFMGCLPLAVTTYVF